MRLISSITRAALGVLLAIAVLAGVIGGCYWLSLVASLRGLEAGIKERDVVKLDKYIDWPRIREQVRADLQAFAMTEMFKGVEKGEGGGLASSIGTLLAGAVAPAVIDRVVDGFVTPQALVRLLAEKPSSEQPALTLARAGFTDFDEYMLLLGSSAPTRPRIRAVLRRDGITWRVVRVVFPPGESPWETNAAGPAAARTYAPAGLAPRLELGKVVPTRTANSLVIEGEVTNSGNMPSELPPLRVVLRDAAEKEVQFKIIDPPKARLDPSETARFKTTFDHPDKAATGVVVTFSGITSPDDTKLGVRSTDSLAPFAAAPPEAPKTPSANKKAPSPKMDPAPRMAKDEPNPEERSYDPDQFNALLKNLAAQPGAPLQGLPGRSSQPRAPLGSQTTASEVDLVRKQIARCWNVPAGARDAKDLVVEIRVVVEPDGSVRQATIVDQARLASDPFFRAAAESARRAFFNPLCRPLHLPPDKYAIWKDLVVDFSPKDIL